jgi:hypothetical protein
MTAVEKTDKTLHEYINGRITDKIYIPRDTQAVYDLSKILAGTKSFDKPMTNDEIIKATNQEDDAVDKLKAQIKASSDCIEFRSLKKTEVIAIGDQLNEFISQLKRDNPDTPEDELRIPFKEQYNTHLFLNSIVSVTDKDGVAVTVQEKTIDQWVEYLEEISDNQPSSYARIVDKLRDLGVSQENEQAIIENLDFLD